MTYMLPPALQFRLLYSKRKVDKVEPVAVALATIVLPVPPAGQKEVHRGW